MQQLQHDISTVKMQKITIIVYLLACVYSSHGLLNNNYEGGHGQQVINQESSSSGGIDFEMVDLLGLERRRLKRSHRMPSLRKAASRFLLEVYDELSDDPHDADVLLRRRKRATAVHTTPDVNFITPLDRMEIERCNNIITFASKSIAAQTNQVVTTVGGEHDTRIRFNTKDVPQDLQLVHATLRAYQDPSIFAEQPDSNSQPGPAPQNLSITISVYQRLGQRQPLEFRIITSLNSTKIYKGWLEFNVTRLLGKWLLRRQARHELKILVHPLVHDNAMDPPISLASAPLELQPFIVGYFNGPDLMEKVQRLRFKRDVQRRIQRRAVANYNRRRPPPPPPVYHAPKTCERLNFTLDFKDLQMHNWVIAPKKFEAYFCGGECNFPLNTHMNATGHAIVQTLMHLKQPNLPKPCCVPTVLGAISILHYLNDDSVNLSKYPQSVARECGCH